ncbi:MAG: gliding motility-associated C-terminal domain-containing protein, partial [Saprospiraceae bacterium]|nr:gliding motility-associated C-terminal domain-containing protein [Saprospiraceae bacterium]
TCQGDGFCPNEEFAGPTAYLVCNGDTLDMVTYQWEPAEYIVSGQNTPNPVFRAPSTFMVTVTIQTAEGCEFKDSCQVEILDTPSVMIEVVPEKVLEGLPMSLTAIPGTDDPYAYKWSTNETTQTIVVMPPVDSTFFSVTITDAKGCMASDTVGVRSLPCIVGVPNAFSPNGNGQNETFRVRSSCPLDYFELKILNRWGQEVYRTKDQEAGWDGTMNGKRLSPDVFAYCVIYSCPNEHEKKTLLGDVTLFR